LLRVSRKSVYGAMAWLSFVHIWIGSTACMAMDLKHESADLIHAGFDHITGTLVPRLHTHNHTQLAGQQILDKFPKIRKPLLVTATALPIEAAIMVKLLRQWNSLGKVPEPVQHHVELESAALLANKMAEQAHLQQSIHGLKYQVAILMATTVVLTLVVACVLSNRFYRPSDQNQPTVLLVRNGRDYKGKRRSSRGYNIVGNLNLKSSSSKGSLQATPRGSRESLSLTPRTATPRDLTRCSSNATWAEDLELGEYTLPPCDSGSDTPDSDDNTCGRTKSLTHWLKDEISDPEMGDRPTEQTRRSDRGRKITFKLAYSKPTMNDEQPRMQAENLLDRPVRRKSSLSDWLNNDINSLDDSPHDLEAGTNDEVSSGE